MILTVLAKQKHHEPLGSRTPDEERSQKKLRVVIFIYLHLLQLLLLLRFGLMHKLRVQQLTCSVRVQQLTCNFYFSSRYFQSTSSVAILFFFKWYPFSLHLVSYTSSILDSSGSRGDVLG